METEDNKPTDKKDEGEKANLILNNQPQDSLIIADIKLCSSYYNVAQLSTLVIWLLKQRAIKDYLFEVQMSRSINGKTYYD